MSATGGGFGNQGQGNPPNMPNFPQYQPQSVEPAKSGGGWLKTCLIIGGIGLLLVVLVTVIGGLVMATQTSKMFAWIFEVAKPETMRQLTAENTPEEKKIFEETYDKSVASIKSDGIIKSVTKHQKTYELYSEISADKQITPEESRKFIQVFESEESGVPAGDMPSAPPGAESQPEDAPPPPPPPPPLEETPAEQPQGGQ